jgi:hypothetical protein
MAMINQKTGQRQGNANVELYNLARGQSYSSCNSSGGTSGSATSTCVFNDITKGTNSVPCTAGSTNCSNTTTSGFGVLEANGVAAYSAGTGYDLATGLGSPNVANLINGWTTPVPSGNATTVTISPATVNGTAGSVGGNLTGSVSGSGGTPTGLVIFENASTGAPVGSATLSGGSYSMALALLPQGTYTVKAHYSGDSTFAPKDSAATTSVSLTPQSSRVVVSFVGFPTSNTVTITTAAQTVAYGSNYILRVDVVNSGGSPCQTVNTSGGGTVNFVCPTGQIALFDGGNPLNDFPKAQNMNATNVARLNDRGFAEDQPIQLTPGAHAITATYTADASSSFTSSSSSNTLSITITPAATTTAISSNTLSVTSGGSVTLTANIGTSSNSAQGPTGTVQFLNGGASLGSAATCTPKAANNNATPAVPASCTAQLTTALSSLPPGFLGDARPRHTPLVILTWLAAVLSLLSFLVAAQMTRGHRRYAYAGAAFFLIAAATLAGCGGGSSSGGGGGGSARTITAKYSGDANYGSSTSNSITITIE